MNDVEEKLRRLTLNDERCVQSLMAVGAGDAEAFGLDRKTHALLRVGALLAQGAGDVSCRWGVELAQQAGATEQELFGVLAAIAPIVGAAHVVSAAPVLALAIGYDVEAAFEGAESDIPKRPSARDN